MKFYSDYLAPDSIEDILDDFRGTLIGNTVQLAYEHDMKRSQTRKHGIEFQLGSSTTQSFAPVHLRYHIAENLLEGRISEFGRVHKIMRGATTRRVRNNGKNCHTHPYSATWIEHGFLFREFFERFDDAATDAYLSHVDFEHRTNPAFSLGLLYDNKITHIDFGYVDEFKGAHVNEHMDGSADYLWPLGEVRMSGTAYDGGLIQSILVDHSAPVKKVIGRKEDRYGFAEYAGLALTYNPAYDGLGDDLTGFLGDDRSASAQQEVVDRLYPSYRDELATEKAEETV